MTKSFLKLMFVSIIIMGGGVVLSACDRMDQNPLRHAVKKHLQDYSYEGADDLIYDAQYNLAATTPVLVGTLNNVDKLERSSTFGRIVSEQVSARFSQRGFSVSELKMRNSVNIKEGLGDPAESGEYLLSRDIGAISGEHRAAAVVTGTYAVAGNDIFVNLKLIDVASGKIISATDYNVPLDSNIRSLVDGDVTTFYGNSMAY